MSMPVTIAKEFGSATAGVAEFHIASPPALGLCVFAERVNSLDNRSLFLFVSLLLPGSGYNHNAVPLFIRPMAADCWKAVILYLHFKLLRHACMECQCSKRQTDT